MKPSRFNFRVWSDSKKIMCPVSGVHRIKSSLMQSTGILDTKGIEMFEGDIVVAYKNGYPPPFIHKCGWHSDANQILGLIAFEHAGLRLVKCRFSHTCMQSYNEEFSCSLSGSGILENGKFNCFEVVGNKYENMELFRF